MEVVIGCMAVQMEELIDFIQANPDSRELKRALAVELVIKNYKPSIIANILGGSVSFISKWKYIFLEQGITGLKLKYIGSRSYLSSAQKETVLSWLKQKDYWHLSELKKYLLDSFNVVFESNQSYYDKFYAG